jgi:hypothetical protein
MLMITLSHLLLLFNSLHLCNSGYDGIAIISNYGYLSPSIPAFPCKYCDIRYCLFIFFMACFQAWSPPWTLWRQPPAMPALRTWRSLTSPQSSPAWMAFTPPTTRLAATLVAISRAVVFVLAHGPKLAVRYETPSGLVQLACCPILGVSSLGVQAILEKAACKPSASIRNACQPSHYPCSLTRA